MREKKIKKKERNRKLLFALQRRQKKRLIQSSPPQFSFSSTTKKNPESSSSSSSSYIIPSYSRYLLIIGKRYPFLENVVPIVYNSNQIKLIYRWAKLNRFPFSKSIGEATIVVFMCLWDLSIFVWIWIFFFWIWIMMVGFLILFD